MTERIHCPRCKKPRPTAEEIGAGVESYVAAMDAYHPCCNPTCGGKSGTGCYHCHHPSFWKGKVSVDYETATRQRLARLTRDPEPDIEF